MSLIWLKMNLFFIVGLSLAKFTSTGFDELNLITFTREILTGYSFHYLLHCGWFFSPNANNPNIGSFYHREVSIAWDTVSWYSYISHVMIFTTMINDVNQSSHCYKCDFCFKYVLFNEGLVWDITFYCLGSSCLFPLNILESGDQPLPKLLLCSSYFHMSSTWVYFCLDTTILLLLWFWYNPWMILLLFYNLSSYDLVWWDKCRNQII